MKTTAIYLLIISSLFLAFTAKASKNTVADSLMRQLDEVIANRPHYQQEKENHLEVLQQNYFNAPDDRARFDALSHLYDDYHNFNADSAYNISRRQEALAERIGDPNLIVNARMNRANIMSATGMYHETLQLMDSVKPSALPDYLRPYYFHIMRTVYGRLADFSAFPDEKMRYNELTNAFRDSIMAANDPNSLPHIITKADMLNVKGKPDAAIDVLHKFMNDNDLSEHEIAICAWTLSESYGLLGEKEKQKEMLLLSSISDMKSSVREYVSLRQLALLLYEEGDLNRAYKMMSIAVDDAAKCNARQRIVELSAYYPAINGIYVDAVQGQKRSLEITTIIITVLSILLLALLLYMRKQMKRIAKARKETEEAYRQVNLGAEQLRASNEKLSDANNAIAEISELKEVYIGRYMDQCLDYIEKLDSYRKRIGKLLNAGRSEELRKLVKSSSVVDDELKAFYQQFDNTFLSLFPTFVEDLNSLLIPEEAIIPKRPGSLNTELRIYALIRLGISDSDKIAKFLRYSLTTIYNYRTRMRNKAKGDRAQLEVEILKIGRAG